MFRLCRCCQSCWEDCYWNCIEEKYCYDESIAKYNEDEDDEEYSKNKTSKNNSSENLSPICAQPKPIIQRACSKIHENDLRREIQSNVPILAPEIMSVFENSQIFNEEKNRKDSLKVTKFSPRVQIRTIDEEKETDKELLLQDGEGGDEMKDTKNEKIDIVVQEEPSDNSEIVLRVKKYEKNEALPKTRHSMFRESINTFNTRRPASENDIFTISSTPDINPIAFTHMPKYYLETPTIEKYRESISLQSIQTASRENYDSTDLSMPRYYRKSELFVPDISKSTSNIITKPQNVEKSERLKNIRTQITPLNIHNNKNDKPKA